MFRNTDRDAVIDLWIECGLIVPSNNPVSDIERKIADSPDLFFVGEINGKVVASCMSGYDGHRGWIYYLAVKPSLRKRSIASNLMRHAENALEELGCPKIDLMVRKNNEQVISFYRKIGYDEDPVVVLSRRLYEDPV